MYTLKHARERGFSDLAGFGFIFTQDLFYDVNCKLSKMVFHFSIPTIKHFYDLAITTAEKSRLEITFGIKQERESTHSRIGTGQKRSTEVGSSIIPSKFTLAIKIPATVFRRAENQLKSLKLCLQI